MMIISTRLAAHRRSIQHPRRHKRDPTARSKTVQTTHSRHTERKHHGSTMNPPRITSAATPPRRSIVASAAPPKDVQKSAAHPLCPTISLHRNSRTSIEHCQRAAFSFQIQLRSTVHSKSLISFLRADTTNTHSTAVTNTEDNVVQV